MPVNHHKSVAKDDVPLLRRRYIYKYIYIYTYIYVCVCVNRAVYVVTPSVVQLSYMVCYHGLISDDLNYMSARGAIVNKLK